MGTGLGAESLLAAAHAAAQVPRAAPVLTHAPPAERERAAQMCALLLDLGRWACGALREDELALCCVRVDMLQQRSRAS